MGTEIREQLATAKEELNTLQYEHEKKLQREALRFGLSSSDPKEVKPLFADANPPDGHLQARFEVFEQEVSQSI